MSKSFRAIAAMLAASLGALCVATPASALSLVTFVSGKGVNTGTCTAPASPCRTFQYAMAQTVPGGEIKALDAANYGSIAINKSINITGAEGASIIRNTSGTAIAIAAGATGVVALSNLTVDGFNRTGNNGVLLSSAASLTIRNCVFRNFANDGVSLQPAGGLKFLISESVMADNGASGVYVASPNSTIRGEIEKISAQKNVNGIWVSSGFLVFTQVSIVDSTISNNSNNGITAAGVGGPTLHLTGSTAQLNTYGVRVIAGQAKSAGNNSISANVIDVDPAGALTKIGTQ